MFDFQFQGMCTKVLVSNFNAKSNISHSESNISTSELPSCAYAELLIYNSKNHEWRFKSPTSILSHQDPNLS